MAKRRAEDVAPNKTSSKRPKLSPIDRLSNLSDELLLRILSSLSTYDLTECQRVSRRFQTVAGDSQLWRAAYYDRFVRPRVSRLPKSKGRHSTTSPPTPSKLSRWLTDDYPIKRGMATNWKRQYKLRHKWSNGTCKIKDIPLPSSPVLPVLAKLQDGVVYTVDSGEGLRAWSYKDDQKLLATRPLEAISTVQHSVQPSSLAIDTTHTNQSYQQLVIGFTDGAFSIYIYRKREKSFEHSYSYPGSSNGRIYAMALSWPFVLSISATQTLSLHKFDAAESDRPSLTNLSDPRLVTSLKSHTVWAPLSLSLRIQHSHIIAAIAYCTPAYFSSWTTGIQEVHLTFNGEILDSRSASAHNHGTSPSSTKVSGFSMSASETTSCPPSTLNASSAKPTSLSYSHPYLLAGHSDNTLTLYMVTSTTEVLSISAGKRLWGHTSSVFDAHVGNRGKAVSVSSRGNEVRIWELERSQFLDRHRAEVGGDTLSVQIIPESRQSVSSRVNVDSGVLAPRSCGQELASSTAKDLELTRAWVGFDEENVVVLREQSHGRQALSIYDFS